MAKKDGLEFGIGCGLQFLWLSGLLLAAVLHRNTEAVRIGFNLTAGSMVVAAVAAIIWLLRNRQAPRERKMAIALGLAFNGVIPVLGYVLMVHLWSVP